MDRSRAGKVILIVIIAIMGPKAPDFVGRHLVAFSSTLRTGYCLHFNSLTQCASSYGFAHYTKTYIKQASC